MKVLIADDNPMFRLLLERHVRSWGYEPVLAEDGEMAWGILAGEHAPRVALLDWQMPGIDGVEICRRLKRNLSLPFIYTIMLTSRDAKEDLITALEAGADDYLAKPVDAAILRSRLTVGVRIVGAVPPKEWSLPRVPGYDVVKVLGRGTSGTVWRAVQAATGREVALKIVRPDLVSHDMLTRFAREIQITQSLDHPNVARVYDSRVDDAICYYSMELIDGQELNKHVVEHKLRPADVLRLMISICDGVEHAHGRDVVHRDLKPANILVTPAGAPKVVDFGLAKLLRRTDVATDAMQTLQHVAVGTPVYMAPEQARGHGDQVDARTDVYAIGVMLYMLLLGHHPHKLVRTDNWEIMRCIAHGEVRRPSTFEPGIDRLLEETLLKSLAHDPAGRYPSAGSLGVDLRRCLPK